MYSSRIRSLENAISILARENRRDFDQSQIDDLKNLLFQLRVERAGTLPKGTPWMNPLFTSPESGSIYYVAFLSWERVPQPDYPGSMIDRVTPYWDIELLLHENGIWLTLDNRWAFSELPSGSKPHRPIHLFALGGSFGDIGGIKNHADQIFHCCVARKDLDDWAAWVKKSVEARARIIFAPK